MSTKNTKIHLTKSNLDNILQELAKEYRKLVGKNMPAEIIMVGGGAILARYGFREYSYDLDVIIKASSAMKQAATIVADRYNMPANWLNSDFQRTDSYSTTLSEISKPYRTFANIVNVRVVEDEYLVAMKLRSGRIYKHDMSDIVGIIWEHEIAGKPLDKTTIEIAFVKLYGSDSKMKESSRELLEIVYATDDIESLYNSVLNSEQQMRGIVLKFEEDYSNVINIENHDDIIATLKSKHELSFVQQQQKKTLIEQS